MLAQELCGAKAVLCLGFYLENAMSGQSGDGNESNTLLGVVLGGLIVVVVVLGFLMFTDHRGGHWHPAFHPGMQSDH